MKIPDHVETTKGVMMNGDSSPSANTELMYELQPARQKDDIGMQFSEEIARTPAAEPETTQLNHSIPAPGRNTKVAVQRRSTEEEEAIESAAEPVDISQPQTKVGLEPQEEVDGDPDRLDLRKWSSLEPSEPEDDGCGVRCLSYTVQCCDCVIL